MSIAHQFKDKIRTDDVLISESVDFSGLLLSNHVLQGLTDAGFKKPSPIQLKAIPLGRCGLDLIVQAKSGTGKTCVFTVVALESLQLQSVCVQVLVLAPTREIALQIQDVIQTIGKPMKGLKCHTFIGGLPVHVDKTVAKNCHIAIGTPGRVKQLIELEALKTSSIRLLILDEADKLLEEGFQESINWIYSTLPENKQILALSATYPESLAQHLTAYMRNPTFIRLNITDPALLGIKQYHVVVPNHPMPNIVFNAKTEAIVKILSSVSFQQCLIFSNLQTRAQNLQSELQSRNWPTACIAGHLDQATRNLAMEQLKMYKCRILISTDLTSRGIDADKVNLVINLDVPFDHETYLHRIGRAGRFGSYGAAITIVTKGGQDAELWAVEKKCKTYIPKLPDPIPNDLVTKHLPIKIDDIVSTQQIMNNPAFEMEASLEVPSNNTSSPAEETYTSSVSYMISDHSQQKSLISEETMIAGEAENVQKSKKDTAPIKSGLLSFSGTFMPDTEPILIEGRSRSCELGLLSLCEPSMIPEDCHSEINTENKHDISTVDRDVILEDSLSELNTENKHDHDVIPGYFLNEISAQNDHEISTVNHDVILEDSLREISAQNDHEISTVNHDVILEDSLREISAENDHEIYTVNHGAILEDSLHEINAENENVLFSTVNYDHCKQERQDLKASESVDTVLTLSVGDSKTNSESVDTVLTMSVGDSESVDTVLTMSVGDSKTNSNTSALQMNSLTFNACSDSVLSQSVSTADELECTESKLSKVGLEASCHVCINTTGPENSVNFIKTVVKSTDSELLQGSEENTISPENCEHKASHLQQCSMECQTDVNGSFCDDSMVKNNEKNEDGLYKTNDISEFNENSCSDSVSISMEMSMKNDSNAVQNMESYIDNNSREILTETLSVSNLLDIKSGSVCFSVSKNEVAGDMFSNSVHPSVSDSSNTNTAVEAIYSSETNARITSVHEQIEPLLLTDSEKVINGDSILKVLQPYAYASAYIDSDSQSVGEISQVANKKLAHGRVLDKISTGSKRSGHLRSFALSGFLDRVNEDLSSLRTKKINSSLINADENNDGSSNATMVGDFDTIMTDSVPVGYNGGGDCIDVSCSLTPSKCILVNQTSDVTVKCDDAAANNIDLESLGGGDSGLLEEAGKSSLHISGCDLHGKSTMNNEVEILNGSTEKHSESQHKDVEYMQPSGCENEVCNAATTAVNQPALFTEPATVFNSLPSSKSQDVSKPPKTLLAAYFSSFLSPSGKCNQLYTFADLEADHLEFCQDFDKTPMVDSCTKELMSNLMIEDFVESKDLQEVCAYEAAKLSLLKSKFHDTLLDARKKKILSQNEAELKLKRDSSAVRQAFQINKHSHEIVGSKEGKIREKPLQSGDQVLLNRQQAKQQHTKRNKVGGKNLKGSDSLNWRSGKSEQILNVNEMQSKKGHNISSMKEMSSTNENVNKEAQGKGYSGIDKVSHSSVTTFSKQKPVLNQQNKRVLNETHGNMQEYDQQRNTERLKGQDNPKLGNVKMKDVEVKGPDKTEQKYMFSESKDDECKALDDMHAQMLMKRKERKLRGSNLTGEDSLPTSHVLGVETVTAVEAEPGFSVAETKKVCTNLSKDSADSERSSTLKTDLEIKENVTDIHPENGNNLAVKLKSGHHAGENNDPSDSLDYQTSMSDGHPRNKQSIKNQVIQKGDPRNATQDKKNQKAAKSDKSRNATQDKKSQKAAKSDKSRNATQDKKKQKAAKSDQSEHLSNSSDDQRRPPKPSKFKARLAGLEVSDGSTSSPSDLSLSSASDISDVNSSDVDNEEIILASQCYTNKYAREGSGELKNGSKGRKKEAAKNIPENSTNCRQHKHGKHLKQSICRPRSNYFQYYGVPVEDSSMFNMPGYPYPTHFYLDHESVYKYNQYLQEHFITELPSPTVKYSSKNAKQKKNHKKCDPSQISESHSQKQREMSKRPRTTQTLDSHHYCESQSPTKKSGNHHNRKMKTDKCKDSESEDICSSDDSMDVIGYPLHTFNQYQPFTYIPWQGYPQMYSHKNAMSWFQPHTNVPQSFWQYGYPTQPNYGMIQPLSFYVPQTQLSPYPYPGFYCDNQFSYTQPMLQYQISSSQALRDYVSQMTKMLCCLSTKHRARVSRKD